MKTRMKRVLGCTASVCAFTALFSATAFAADTNNSAWDYQAAANVTTQVNIRAYADSNSSIIGYLSKGATADVVEKGDTWTHVISNGVEGYIMNEYLVYGQEAKDLASVYGEAGVSVSWDGVNVFAEPDAAASILTTASTGQEYVVVGSSDLWYTVQLDDATIAYVPVEDAQSTVVTERAIPVETTYTADTTSDYTEDTTSYTEDTTAYTDSYTDTAAETYTDTTTYDDGTSYTEQAEQSYETEAQTQDTTDYTDSYTESYTEDTTSTESYYDETTEDTYTDTTEAPSTGTVSDEPTSEETVTTANSDEVSLLAAIIYCEAGNQSRDGMVAVGAVVLNRVASGSFPNSISEVIYQSGQFTPASSGALASALASGVPSACTEAAQAALNGENPVGGALYFNTGSGKGTQIGAHQFY